MDINFGIKDVIDILLVAFLMFQTYRLIKGTNAVNIFVGVIAFIICWFIVSFVFKMELLGAIFDKLVSVGSIALIIIFQNEIRRFFSMIGRRRNFKFLEWLTKNTENGIEMESSDVLQLTLACKNMAETKCGALILIEKDADLYNYMQTGEIINADISSRLIQNIFFKNTPLHDGAIIIAKKKIVSAACILPISQNRDIPKKLGLRHRSALGIVEKTDAIAIVVSEETGEISIASNGNIDVNISIEELERRLSEEAVFSKGEKNQQ